MLPASKFRLRSGSRFVQRTRMNDDGNTQGQSRLIHSRRYRSHTRPWDPNAYLLNNGREVLEVQSTQLCEAIQVGARQRVQDLLDNGADVNEMGYYRGYGEPVLVTAVRYENYHLIPILLNRKANVNKTSERGHTALIRACQKGHRNTISLLLQHGANPNALDNAKLSPLYWAVKSCDEYAVQLLLEHGAFVSLNLQHNTTSLHSACSLSNLKIVSMLLDHVVDINACDDYGESALFCALRSNNHSIASMLLEKAACVNILNMDLRLPLHIAAANYHQSVDLVELLLKHGAWINVMDRYGHTPLVLSLRDAFFNHRFNLSLPIGLIKHGSSLNDEQCRISLGWSVTSHGSFDLIRMAVGAGLNLHDLDWVKDYISGNPGRRRWYSSYEYNEETEKEFIIYLNYCLKNPLKLSEICRLFIRQYISKFADYGSIYYLLQQLPLPNTLKSFLRLED